MDTGILTIYREHKGGRINYKKEYNTNKLLPWGKNKMANQTARVYNSQTQLTKEKTNALR